MGVEVGGGWEEKGSLEEDLSGGGFEEVTTTDYFGHVVIGVADDTG
ncbi:MAG: hypothetical protein JWQ49_522 [Edaphobacter sp.]|nr:hypothetical protein [Edaphobacter sp.]